MEGDLFIARGQPSGKPAEATGFYPGPRACATHGPQGGQAPSSFGGRRAGGRMGGSRAAPTNTPSFLQTPLEAPRHRAQPAPAIAPWCLLRSARAEVVRATVGTAKLPHCTRLTLTTGEFTAQRK